MCNFICGTHHMLLYRPVIQYHVTFERHSGCALTLSVVDEQNSETAQTIVNDKFLNMFDHCQMATVWKCIQSSLLMWSPVLEDHLS